MKYSVIIPVFNRPDEVDELLQSLTLQTERDFEVVVVEDGSTIPCKKVCDGYAGALNMPARASFTPGGFPFDALFGLFP